MENAIIGGIFGTQTKWDANGNMVTQDEFHLRIYKDLWQSGAIKRLKGNMLHIYLTIAMHLDKSGEGWPTQKRIAEMCGLNKDTVWKSIKKLVAQGFIEIEKVRTTGKYDNSVYKIKFTPISENTQDKSISTSTDLSDRQNRTDKSGTKKELSFKQEPSFKKDLKKQQQQKEKRVVVVKVAIEKKFDQKITKKGVREIITLADKHQVDLDSKIQNTYDFHTFVQRCNSVIAAIKYAITHGDWEIVKQEDKSKKKKIKDPKSLPKAVREQMEKEKEVEDIPELEARKARIQEKLENMNQKEGVKFGN